MRGASKSTHRTYNITFAAGTAALNMNPIRRLSSGDHDAVVEVYRQAVLCSTAPLYSPAQQTAWAAQADRLRPHLHRGEGLVSCNDNNRVEAFALRDPEDRVALLYCHPRSQRQGRARSLLRALEHNARQQGLRQLRTEASFLSRDLFAAEGWQVSWQEELLIGRVLFRRFRMHKPLTPILT